MQHADAETVHRLLDYRGLVEALRQAHRTSSQPEVSFVVRNDPAGGGNTFVSLIAWAPGDVIATKQVGVFPGNLSLDPPQHAIQGLVSLFDGSTGALLLTSDGAAMTFRKTVSDSALGADYLARKDAATLVIAGAGGLAPYVAAAYLAVRPSIKRVFLWNRTPSRAEALALDLQHLPASVTAVPTLAEVLPEADIVSCVTMATTPIVQGALLKPGAHVDLIGAYLPEMREADDEVIRRAGQVFVDTRANCEISGEIAEPLAKGLISRDQIVADLFDLSAGRHPGRTSADQITVYKNLGGAHLDLFTAKHLLARMQAAR